MSSEEKKATLKALLFYMKSQLAGSTISGKQNPADFVADRITQAATKSTMFAFAERFAELIGVGAASSSEAAQGFVAAASGVHWQALLAMLRQHPKLVTQMLFVSAKKEGESIAFDKMLASLDVEQLMPDVVTESDMVAFKPKFDINIQVACVSPLAHGADTKSGNATLFRRQDALGKNGRIMRLPIYAGNALRGQLRDIISLHFLKTLEIPKTALWFFHTIFSGGILEEKSDAMKQLQKRTGGAAGVFKVEGIREFRDMVPVIGLLGGAIGNRIIPGKIKVADLRPQCVEWGTGDKPVAELFDWVFMTRRDDNAENRSADEEHRGMIVTTEVLKPGTVLNGGIDIDDHALDIEIAALGNALNILKNKGYLGGEGRRGFGRVEMEIDREIDAQPYLDYLSEKREVIVKYLTDIGAIVEEKNPDPVASAPEAKEAEAEE